LNEVNLHLSLYYYNITNVIVGSANGRVKLLTLVNECLDPSPQQTPSGSWPNTPWSGQQQFDEGKSGSVLSSPGKTTPTGAENESPSSAGSQGQQSMWGGETRKQVLPPPGWEKPMWGGGDTGSQGFERQQEAGESNAFSDNMSGSGTGKEFGWGNQTAGDNLGRWRERRLGCFSSDFQQRRMGR
jgi:hypothetical protein